MNYIFGKIKNSFSIESIFNQAEKKRRGIRNYPVDKIIDILDKVSKLWDNPSYHLRKIALKEMPALTGFHPSMIEEEINFLVDLLKRENIEKRIKCELRGKQYMDGWAYSDDLDGYLRAEPSGVVVHVGAGNVFVGPIDSVIQGIITKNVNILKMSTDDPVFPLLFCQSLRQADKDGIISGSVAALSWKGGDDETESTVKRKADVIVVYGGKDTVLAYRKGLGIHTKLVEYGPKYSLVLISKEIFNNENKVVVAGFSLRNQGMPDRALKKLAYEIAYDASRWEQSACASPHVIYVEEGKKPGANAEKLIQELSAAFEKVQKVLPQKKLCVDEQVEITRVRQLAQAAKADKGTEYKFGKGESAWSIIYEKDPRFTVSCLNRTIFIKSVGTGRDLSLQDVSKILKPMGKYIQTVAIAAPLELRRELAAQFSFIGADRFTEIGRMTRRAHGAPHDGVYSLEQLIRWSSLTGGDCNEKWGLSLSAGTVPIFQLRELISFAREHSPFYKEKYKTVGADPCVRPFGAPLQNIPITTPDQLKKNLPPKNNRALTAKPENGYVFTSGGTTGDPKFVFRSAREQDYNAEFLAKGLLSAVLEKGDTVANLLFAGNMWGSFLSFSRALEKAGCQILPIGGNISVDDILNYLVLFKPDAVLAIPSVLLSLAGAIEERKIKIKIPKILSGGEHVFKQNLNYIKKVFSTERMASLGYATNDVGAIGYQCRHISGGFHHIHNDLQYVEILNPKTLKLVKIGEQGKVIVTNLNRRLEPIIRYDVGDMGRWTDKKCPCGEPGPIFELLGRSDDILIIGGGNIYPEVIREAIAKVPGLSPHFTMAAQLKNGKDQLVVKVESVGACHGMPLQKKLESQIYANSKELRTMLDKKLIAPIVIEILPPKTLPRNPRTGKLRLVEDRRQ